MTAPICLYCNMTAVFHDKSDFIYGRDYGAVYACVNYPKCDAYVGCHKGTRMPLGRLANKSLRAAKKRAHASFDRLWLAKMEFGHTKGYARTRAYLWLSEQLGVPPDACHIGMFDEALCREVVRVCEPHLKKLD